MKHAFFIPILFFLCFLFLIYFFLPKYSNFRSLEQDISDIKISLGQKQAYFSELQSISNKLIEQRDVVDKIRAALPEEVSLASLLNFFQKKASENGLILSNFNQSQSFSQQQQEEEVSESKVQEMNINIGLQGSFLSLINFLQAIEKSSRIIEIENINLSDSGEGFMKSSLLLKVYSYSK